MSYEIEPDGFEVPPLPGGVSVAADEEDAQERLGRDLLISAKQAVGRRGIFHLALSGGVAAGTFPNSVRPRPRFCRTVSDQARKSLLSKGVLCLGNFLSAGNAYFWLSGKPDFRKSGDVTGGGTLCNLGGGNPLLVFEFFPKSRSGRL